MRFRESLDYLYSLQKFGIKLGLDNIRTLLERLGRPESSYGVIHVAGTNGKGSVCAGLACVLQKAGFRVGLYTSPHLHSFTERIRVNGEVVGEDQVAFYTDELRVVAGSLPSTFFEFTTAMALLHFQRQQIDFAVLEVGMGGRLDATNAVESPMVSVITPICHDHSEHLGADLKAIAAEKGGIIKPGVPLVVGRQATDSLNVLLGLAERQRAPVCLFDRDFSSQPTTDGFSYQGMTLKLDDLHSGLAGSHQHENLSMALCASEILMARGVSIPLAAMREGVMEVNWPGRLEWWNGDQILLDGAHNEGGATVLAAYLRALAPRGIRWVVGIKGDKNVRDILTPLLPLVSTLYCTTPPIETAVSAKELAAVGVASGCVATVFEDCAAALATALAERRPQEIVLVAGSLFLVAAAREYLLNNPALG